MTRARFQPNPGAAKQIAQSPAVTQGLQRAAERIADEARRIARAEAYDTGAYHDSITAETVATAGGQQVQVRTGGRDTFYARYIEFGTSREPAKSVLRRAAAVQGRVVNRRSR